jgi:hypothetical protein
MSSILIAISPEGSKARGTVSTSMIFSAENPISALRLFVRCRTHSMSFHSHLFHYHLLAPYGIHLLDQQYDLFPSLTVLRNVIDGKMMLSCV